MQVGQQRVGTTVYTSPVNPQQWGIRLFVIVAHATVCLSNSAFFLGCCANQLGYLLEVKNKRRRLHIRKRLHCYLLVLKSVILATACQEQYCQGE